MYPATMQMIGAERGPARRRPSSPQEPATRYPARLALARRRRRHGTRTARRRWPDGVPARRRSIARAGRGAASPPRKGPPGCRAHDCAAQQGMPQAPGSPWWGSASWLIRSFAQPARKTTGSAPGQLRLAASNGNRRHRSGSQRARSWAPADRFGRPVPATLTRLTRAAGPRTLLPGPARSAQAESGTTSAPRRQQGHEYSHARPRRRRGAGRGRRRIGQSDA